MTTNARPITDEEKARFNHLNKQNLEFLMDRYNRVNRWVIADMVRRTAYHYPHKTALIIEDALYGQDPQTGHARDLQRPV